MKTNLIYFLVITFYLNSCSASSQQTTKSNDLPLLSIDNEGLFPILDSITVLEKKCDYYNDSLFYTIDIREVKGAYELQIESSNNINTALDYFQPTLGYLYYKEHLFLIYGTYKKFFSMTEKTKKFSYTKYDASQNKSDTTTIDHVIDDSHSYWNYWYAKDKFIFQGKSSFCN